MQFEPNYWTCAMGSFPHLDAAQASKLLQNVLDIPMWAQLPRRTFRENMYVQYSASLPSIHVDEQAEKIFFDTSGDLPLMLEAFYERYLAQDLDSFGLSLAYAAGFYQLLDSLPPISPKDILDAGFSSWIKGQVTGPVSMGLTITDQDLRASLYDDMLADVLVKNAAMNARWQVRQLNAVRPNVIISVDEPYMASFGSAYISLSRESVVTMLDEVIEAIHAEGALAALHCCANTDWSVLMATQADILSLDAYGYLDNLSLYPSELRAFLGRGGVVAWGIVPNTERIFEVSAAELVDKLRAGLVLIGERAERQGLKIEPTEFAARSLVTPSCGLGPATIEVAERALGMLGEVGEALRAG